MLFAGVASIVAVAVLVTTPTKLLILPDRKPRTNFDPRWVEYLHEFLSGSMSGFWGGKIYDLSDRRATRVGLGMVTRGEFTLIIASLLIVTETGSAPAPAVAVQLNAFAVGYVLAMSILGTMLMQYSGLFEDRVVAWRGSE